MELLMRYGVPRPAARWMAGAAYYAGVAAICVPFVFVFYWMVLGAMKTQVQNTAYPPIFLFRPTFENFYKVFVANQFVQYIVNSFTVSGGAHCWRCSSGCPPPTSSRGTPARHRPGHPGRPHGPAPELRGPLLHPLPVAGMD